MSLLGTRLGVILFQFPASFAASKSNIERISSFLENKERIAGGRLAFEFRQKDFFQEKICRLLKKHNVALVFSDSPRFPCSYCRTADFIYMRFHGPDRLYASKYSPDELSKFASLIRKYSSKGLDVFAYFNNDFSAYAVENATQLKGILNKLN